ncbi:MAG: hypothetical protein VW518_09860, partial [Burkholderiaceae bacterium]
MICSEDYFNKNSINHLLDQINNTPTLEENDVIKDYTKELSKKNNLDKKNSLKIAFLNFGAKDNIKNNFISRN